MPIEQQWKGIDSAPGNCDLELAVIEQATPHALVFPCRRTHAGWVHAETKALVKVSPTHWRFWRQSD
jgi:hypothetical protein